MIEVIQSKIDACSHPLAWFAQGVTVLESDSQCETMTEELVPGQKSRERAGHFCVEIKCVLLYTEFGLAMST